MARAVGEQSDKPIVSTFLGTEGVPELLRVPDVAGSSAGRGSVPSYPAVEAAVRALAHVVEYAVWVRVPQSAVVEPGANDLDAARHLVNEVLMRHPEGRDLSFDEQFRLLTAYGIDLWDTYAVSTLDEATTAGEALGWDVVLKATADHLRDRPDLAHVWRNIDGPDHMRDAWASLHALVSDDDSGFIVQRTAPPGVPIAIRSIEDPLFGPVVSFGISGPMTELLADRSYRIPPLGSRDAAAMVREVRSAPLLFGYRGAEVVDVGEVERLIRRVAQLQNDMPQISALELGLVLAGPHGSSVLSAEARLEPVSDARSDWFVRRMPTQAGDTLPS